MPCIKSRSDSQKEVSALLGVLGKTSVSENGSVECEGSVLKRENCADCKRDGKI